MSDLIQPFLLNVPQSEMDDLAERLKRARWPSPSPVEDGRQGPPLEKIRALADYWQTSYDWRRCESLLNSMGQSRTEIDGVDIHFLHIRSPHLEAMPLIMTHGWPGSVLEFRRVIAPLANPTAHGGSPADAFHLVIPSMPGFGFSGKPREAGWNTSRIASAWAELMNRLGYDRWTAQGGDWGAMVTMTLAHMQMPGLTGIHLNFVPFQPTEKERARATPEEREMLGAAERYDAEYSGYMKLMSTRPQQLAFALSDSPIGLAAFIYALFQDVSDSGGNPEAIFSYDEIIDDIMMYWLPNASASSARLYWEAMQAMRHGGMPSDKVPIPAGISMFAGEQVRLSRDWVESRFEKITHFGEHAHGGHFAALEAPELLVSDIRHSFRLLR